jgi:hypothetical protein
LATGVFFSAGHLPATHRWTASSSLSRARFAGLWRVHSMDRRIFHTWPG